MTATDSAVTATSVPSPARPGSPPSGSPRFASVAPVGESPGGAAMRRRRRSGTRGRGVGGKGDPRRIGDDDRELAFDRLHGPARVDRIARLDERKELGSLALEDDEGGGRPVVDPDAAGFEVGDEAADADLLAERVGQVGEVDVTSLREWVARGGGRRRRGGAGSPPVDPGLLVDPAAAADPATRTSAGLRGRIVKRWSEAVGYGRRTMPVTVAMRSSASVSAAIPAPAWPTTTTCRPPSRISARQRSPSLCTLATGPWIRTSCHS